MASFQDEIFYAAPELSIGSQCFESGLRSCVQHRRRISRQLPQLRIELAPYVVGGMIPRYPQFEGELVKTFSGSPVVLIAPRLLPSAAPIGSE